MPIRRKRSNVGLKAAESPENAKTEVKGANPSLPSAWRLAAVEMLRICGLFPVVTRCNTEDDDDSGEDEIWYGNDEACNAYIPSLVLWSLLVEEFVKEPLREALF